MSDETANADLRIPPQDCRCRWPAEIADNETGHAPNCPVYWKWVVKNVRLVSNLGNRKR